MNALFLIALSLFFQRTLGQVAPAECPLLYAGFVYGIEGGFNCGEMTDDELDAKLDTACKDEYPGSRNIMGSDIVDGGWEKIIDLPSAPRWPFAPSCPVCGTTCDAGGGRLCAFRGASWDINDGEWSEGHFGQVLTAECVWEQICETEEPTSIPTEIPTYIPTFNPLEPTQSPQQPQQPTSGRPRRRRRRRKKRRNKWSDNDNNNNYGWNNPYQNNMNQVGWNNGFGYFGGSQGFGGQWGSNVGHDSHDSHDSHESHESPDLSEIVPHLCINYLEVSNLIVHNIDTSFEDSYYLARGELNGESYYVSVDCDGSKMFGLFPLSYDCDYNEESEDNNGYSYAFFDSKHCQFIYLNENAQFDINNIDCNQDYSDMFYFYDGYDEHDINLLTLNYVTC